MGIAVVDLRKVTGYVWSASAVDLLSYFFFSSRRRHTRFDCDWSSDVCSSDLAQHGGLRMEVPRDVEHEPAVTEAGTVHDANGRQDQTRAGSRRGQEAAQRLQTVKNAGGAGGPGLNTLGGIHDEGGRPRRGLTRD